MRIGYHTTLVLQAMAGGARYGFDIMRVTGLASGTVYPILRRLEASGMVESEWEPDGPAHEERRPARRYYEPTAAGRAALAESLERLRAQRGLLELPAEEGG